MTSPKPALRNQPTSVLSRGRQGRRCRRSQIGIKTAKAHYRLVAEQLGSLTGGCHRQQMILLPTQVSPCTKIALPRLLCALGLLLLILDSRLMSSEVVQSPLVRSFKAFLTTSPHTGKTRFQYRTPGAAAPLEFEAVWFGDDFYIGLVPHDHNTPDARNVLPADGGWNGRRWSHSLSIVTYRDYLSEQAATRIRQRGGLGHERLFHELFSLGVPNLNKTTIRWTTDGFVAKRLDGTRITARLGVSADGRVRSLEYKLAGDSLPTRIAYDYGPELPRDVPNQITVSSVINGKQQELFRYNILSWDSSLAKSSWTNYNPAHLFPTAKVRVDTQSGLLAKVGNKLVPVDPRPTSRQRNPLVPRLIVLAVIVLAAVGFYFALKTKHST